MIDLRTFDPSLLEESRDALRDAFLCETSDPIENEWMFAEKVLSCEGYVPDLCLAALSEGRVIGYNILTKASIGNMSGLALGPIGVRKSHQNQGVGTMLMCEAIERAKRMDAPWIAVLGGDYYSRFGFERGQDHGIILSDDPFINAHVQILFLKEDAKAETSGQLIYCSAFYRENGELI